VAGDGAASMWGSRPSAESAAAALATPVVTGAQTRPGAPGTGEQAPQAARHRPPPVRKTPPSRRLQPGDLICGACGEGNPPVRRFCSRCGESLVEAEVVKRPWWRRLFPGRGPKVMKVAPGQQSTPGKQFDFRLVLRKIFRRVRAVVLLLVMLGALGYGTIPSLRHSVNAKVDAIVGNIKTRVKPEYVPVHAVSHVANMFISHHPGKLAVDEFTNTFWLAPWNPNKEPMLTLNFGQPVTLKEMILYSGDSANYVAFGRPSVLHLVFSNGSSATLTPTDTDKQQTLAISGANKITSVEIQIAGVFPGNSAANVAITEIELFSLKL
jgi:hypothetical protein